jgi:uncharacterized protein (DUF305 family)
MTSRVFSAVAFLVIGAVATLLLTSLRSGPDSPGAPGETDLGFARDMLVHHQQAVTLAQAVLGRTGPSVTQLATSIELNQTREIGQLQGWLTLWDVPLVPSGPPMLWMRGPHDHAAQAATQAAAPAAMPGLATEDEIDALGDLKGTVLDARFLQLMIRHHQGGLLMTRAAATRATLPQVRAVATLMTTEEAQETATMTGLLNSLGERPLPAPV